MTRVQRAIDALITAFHEDRLASRHVYQCAVGTILKAAASREGVGFHHLMNWMEVMERYSKSTLSREQYPEVSSLEALSGFSMKELIQIEEAFEGRSIFGMTEDTYTVNISDVLDDIHRRKGLTLEVRLNNVIDKLNTMEIVEDKDREVYMI
jgi:hypothetical protein